MPIVAKRRKFLFSGFFAAWAAAKLAEWRSASAAETPSYGDAVIRAAAGDSEIVLRTSARFAGAIDSLTWNGQEFIDAADHGRQLQSASNLDHGQAFHPEVFNPTEAGSRRDGAGNRSTSKLLWLKAAGNELLSATQMAFWLAPGETSGGHPATNTTLLSEHLLLKQVRIGYDRWPHVLDYRVTFIVPPGENHRYAQFEALTGYMPPQFSRFETLNPTTGEPAPLSDGPGEQPFPLLFSTPTGSHAMGCFSPDQPSPGFAQAGYGRFRFEAEKVVKWNCVFRLRRAAGIPAGSYSYRLFVPVGSRDLVIKTLRELGEAHKP